MDSLAKFTTISSFKYQNQAAAGLNKVKPVRGETLSHAVATLYEMIPEPARTQPVGDAAIYRVVPNRIRKP